MLLCAEKLALREDGDLRKCTASLCLRRACERQKLSILTRVELRDE